jgi:Hemocyanin, all-alpha domain.
VEANIDHYEHPRVVKNFITMYKKGYLLKRGVPFSVYYQTHKEQAVMLFEMFYFAKDYDTFYKVRAHQTIVQ